MVYISLVDTRNFTEKAIISGTSMKYGDVTLTFNKGNENAIEFEYATGSNVNTLTFSMAWWDSWINDNSWANDTQNSGDYIFRPRTGQFVPNKYS